MGQTDRRHIGTLDTAQFPTSFFIPDPFENAADDEKVVEHREDDEKSIEYEAVHLLRAEDRNGHGLLQNHKHVITIPSVA